MADTTQAQRIDGRALAAAVREDLTHRIEVMVNAGRAPRLDAVIVQGNPAGEVYAQRQARTCEAIGLTYALHTLPADADQQLVIDTIDALNADEACTGIMVHLPLPDGVCMQAVQARIAVHKDVEGVNPANIGGVIYGQRTLVPCTAAAAMHLIESTGIELAGTRAVVVGASGIVGKPVAVLLMQAQATVTSTNIHTEDLVGHCAAADIIVAAAGVPGLIGPEHVKPGAVVIDVGINRVTCPDSGEQRTVGDVDADAVASIAGHLSPVPGGVGPVTVAMLLRNTVEAAQRA
ncbi:MAG: bifunctional 5,10-methylenetetrahydrofolate dehydrogenase/5,10-methenyltetrahydrofolate cyclohydrolase [Phycisphaerales bacterium]|nr:bifunctional 5,10-methylenetetrahydrofolate dehydrogenase/5,10-methenyltetrahydrofolate cyclohydrolase [Phycisphaerales bacterium]